MKNVAIIPARGGSKAIPNKNVVDFCGKPLLAWTIECALEAASISEVYVSTDDSDIAQVAKQYGASVIQRPQEFSCGTSSSEDAILHAIAQIEEHNSIDLIVFLQATSPIRESKDIDLSVSRFIEQKADSLFSGSIISNLCLWKIHNGVFESTTCDFRNRCSRQERKDVYCLENGSIFIFRPEFIKQQNNRLGGRIAFYQMPYWKSFEVDTYDDLMVCEYFMRMKMINKSKCLERLAKCRLFVYDFDGVLTDNKALFREDGLESVFVNRSDGLGVNQIKRLGIKQLILSTETNNVVSERGKKIGVPVVSGIENKKKTLQEYCAQEGFQLIDVAYIGNDLNDLEVMKTVGFSACPSDAYDEVKAVASIVLNVPGGAGVIRSLLSYL